MAEKTLGEIVAGKKKNSFKEEQGLKYEKYLVLAHNILMSREIYFEQGNVEALAEFLALQDFFLPPHFTTMVKCKRCGDVFVNLAKIDQDITLVGCPWCHVFSDEVAQTKRAATQALHEEKKLSEITPGNLLGRKPFVFHSGDED